MRLLTSISLLSAVWISAVGSALAADPIKIGEINQFSGPLAKYGLELARGHELAVDQVNANGGLLGRKVELIRGDATNPQQAIATVEQLATRDKVDLFAGTYMSPVSAAASDEAQRYNRLYWETIATAQELTDRGLSNFVRTGPNATSYAIESVEAIKNLVAPAFNKKPNELKIWIEHEDMIFGTSIGETVKKLLEADGIKAVGMSAHSFKTIDLNDTVLRIKQANPDVLVEIGYVPDGNLLLKTLKNQGYKVPGIMYVVTGDAPETLNAVGAADLEGVLVVSYPRTNLPSSYSPGGKEYLAAYRAKYNEEPAATMGMSGFAGLQMLFDAIRIAGTTDVNKVRAAAAAMDKPLRTYPGGYGVKFDDKFQNTRALPVVVQWQAGEPVTVFPKEAVSAGVTLKNLPYK
jgi:branched-chain amino acid transport system substrate-binding protein